MDNLLEKSITVLEIQNATVNVFDTAQTLVNALAEHFVVLAKEAIASRGSFTVALSGGSTPKALYELLAQAEFSQQIDWSHVLFFLGDERCVRGDDPESNFGMVTGALLSKIDIPKENVFATQGQDIDPEKAAKQYEQCMRDSFKAFGQDMPHFDLVLLGLGPDGHTASLFPGSKGLTQKDSAFIANYVEKFQSNRLTITFPVINGARNVIFLVAGDAKAEIVKDIFQSKAGKYPAQMVRPELGKLEWYMDRAAAASLSGG